MRPERELSPEQTVQIQRQLAEHHHQRYQVSIELSNRLSLPDLIVEPGVFRPEITTSIHLARFLATHPQIFEGKNVLDLGCGTGILGITAALLGAQHVVCADIMLAATVNARENVKKYALENRVEVMQSDLFEAINEHFDVIIFNHPFFSGRPLPEELISQTMLDPGGITCFCFLLEVVSYLRPGGRILMNFLDLAGPTNDPKRLGPRFDFEVVERQRTLLKTGLQRGWFSVYELFLPAIF